MNFHRLFGITAVLSFIAAQAIAQAPPKPAAIDWEEAVSKYRQLDETIKDSQRAALTGARLKDRQRWIIATYAGTELAAAAEAGEANELLTEKRYDEVAAAAMRFINKYPLFTSAHTPPLTACIRVVSSGDVPRETKISAIETMLPGLKDRALMAARLCSTIRKWKLEAVDSYELVKKIAEAAGVYPQTRSTHWEALLAASREMGPDRSAAEFQHFVERYGKDSAEGRRAYITILHVSAKADPVAAKELQSLTDEDASWAAVISPAFENARKLLDQGDGAAAADVLEKALAPIPAYAAENAWLALLRHAALSEPSSLPVLKVLVERAPDGEVVENAFQSIRSLRFDTEGAHLLVKLAARHAVDRDRSGDMAKLATRTVSNMDDSALQLEAFRGAAAMAAKLNAPDMQVHYLLETGKHGWDTSPQEGIAALKEAAAWYPKIPEAAEAGWMLALLDGTLSVTQGPLPREHSATEHLPVRPEMNKLPPAPAEIESTVENKTGISLRKQDPKVNLVASQNALASDSQDTAALAVDKKAETVWTPAMIPASLITPLEKESTVDRVRVAADGPLFFTVSLLDRQGRTLARMERDWAFTDFYRRTTYWPPGDVTLKILPTSGVCFVRIDVYGASEGTVRVHTVEVFGPPVVSQGLSLGKPVALSPDTHSVVVNWEATEPQRKVSYSAAGEWSRGFNLFRWGKFWTRMPKAVKFTSIGGNLAISFYGDNASLVLDDVGAVRWQIDDAPAVQLAHPEETETSTQVAEKLQPGFHVLKIRPVKLTQENDKNPVNAARFVGVDVRGTSRVRMSVRFGTASGKWGQWIGPVSASGDSVAVPAAVEGEKPAFVQSGAFFDANEVQGQESAVLNFIKFEPQTKSADAPSDKRELIVRPHLEESLDEVAGLLQRRMAAVSYAKNGTAAEYEIARRLAEKAGVYLVSDDIAMVPTSGLTVMVGTPLRHRYVRQLLATHGIWNLPTFFNNQDGLVCVVRDLDQAPWVLGAIGDTPEAVVRAGERLLAKINPERASQPIELFASTPLQNIYGWTAAKSQPPLKELSIRMAAGDRRALQFGISANSAVDRIAFSISEPVNDVGSKLSRPLIRPVAFYEWIPFFGDLRIPNGLSLQNEISMPAQSSRGIWMTAITPADAKPGIYKADLAITIGDKKQVIPVVVRVDPFTLPPTTKTSIYSFAYLPYWYHRDGPIFDKALTALARDEAEHGLTHVGTVLAFDWTKEPQTAPASVVVSAAEASPENVAFNPYSENGKNVGANHSLLIAFPAPIKPREIFAAVDAPPETKISLSLWDGQKWVSLLAQTEIEGKKLATAMHWQTNGQPVQYARLSSESKEAFSVDRIGAFTDLGRTHPFTIDFTPIDRQMKIFEAEYAKLGMTPQFIVQSNDRLSNLGSDVYGVNHYYHAGIARTFAPQFNAFLQKTNRAGRVLFKVADEPKDMKYWSAVARDYHDAGMRTMTCHGILKDMELAAGVLDPWCPYYGHNVLLPFFRDRQAKGDKLWWYTYGPPNLRLTGMPPENLVFYWLTAKWHIDGAMSYAAMHASDYSMPVPFRYENGEDHRLLFLPDGSLLDTQRRELEGEGISDLKLIEYVRDAAGRQKDAPLGKSISADLEKLLAETVPYKFGYSIDPQHWIDAREKLYDLAVRVSAGN